METENKEKFMTQTMYHFKHLSCKQKRTLFSENILDMKGDKPQWTINNEKP